MRRIFVSLAVANFLVLLMTAATGIAVLGRWIPSGNHVPLAVLSAILTCFIQVLAFTYLTVTAKIIGQAVHLGGLSVSLIDQSKNLKRTFSRCLALLMGILLFAVATGAQAWRLNEPSLLHLLAGALVLCGAAGVLWKQSSCMAANESVVKVALQSYSQRTSRHPARTEHAKG